MATQLCAGLAQREGELGGQTRWPPEGNLVVLPLLHWKTSTARNTRCLSSAPTARPVGESWGSGDTETCKHRALLSRSSQSHRTSREEPGLQSQERQTAPRHAAPVTAGRSQTSPGLPGVLDCDTRICGDANVNISHVRDEPAAKTRAWASLTNSPKACLKPPNIEAQLGSAGLIPPCLWGEVG